MNGGSAAGFRSVVNAIGEEIWQVWRSKPSVFRIHPTGAGAPSIRKDFKAMFQAEICDANTASVVSSACGIPICRLTAGTKIINGRTVIVNETQIAKQRPNIEAFVKTIE